MGIEDTCMNEKEIDAAINAYHLRLSRSAYRAMDLLKECAEAFLNRDYQAGYKAFQAASKTLTISLIEHKLKEVKKNVKD